MTEPGEKTPPNFLLFHLFADGLCFSTMGNIHLGNLIGDPDIGVAGGIGVFTAQFAVCLVSTGIHHLFLQLTSFPSCSRRRG